MVVFFTGRLTKRAISITSPRLMLCCMPVYEKKPWDKPRDRPPRVSPRPILSLHLNATPHEVHNGTRFPPPRMLWRTGLECTSVVFQCTLVLFVCWFQQIKTESVWIKSRWEWKRIRRVNTLFNLCLRVRIGERRGVRRNYSYSSS